MYSSCLTVRLWANFLPNHETHKTKIYSVASSIHILETIQIWFIPDYALSPGYIKKHFWYKQVSSKPRKAR